MIINGQKAYGKDVSIEDTFDYYRMKLDGKYSASQVIGALDKYTDTKNDIPAPADLIAIISPAPARITQTEFIHAKEQHAREGYPAYGYYGQIIKQYERENAEDRAPQTMTDDPKLLEVARNAVRKIT